MHGHRLVAGMRGVAALPCRRELGSHVDGVVFPRGSGGGRARSRCRRLTVRTRLVFRTCEGGEIGLKPRIAAPKHVLDIGMNIPPGSLTKTWASQASSMLAANGSD